MRQLRYEAARPDLVERLIDVVDHRFGHALAQLVERAKIELTDRPEASVVVDLTDARFSARSPAPGWRNDPRRRRSRRPRRSSGRSPTPGVSLPTSPPCS